METIRVVLEERLLRAADKAVRQLRTNRSGLVRDALRQHSRGLQIRELEAPDCQGYERLPESGPAAEAWDRVTAWPDEDSSGAAASAPTEVNAACA